MSELVVAIVADDLTGAMDAAAPFARRGARTSVVIALEHLAEVIDQGSLPDVLAINTESRHLPADQAARRVATAFGQLLPLTPRVLFKKVDSTLRGNVVAECLAARRCSERGLVVCPAVPVQGRTLRDGQVYVHGEPLAASDYGLDARSAPPVESLPMLFACKGLDIPVIPAGETPDAADAIVDAVSESDLRILARRLLEHPRRWLVVGAAGLTEALAGECFPAVSAAVSAAPPLDKLLIVVGSRCDQARRQIACLCEAYPDLPIVHAMENDSALSAVSRHRLIIPERRPSSRFTAEQVAQGMARCVEELLKLPGRAPLLLLTGGDTAMAVMESLGVRQVELEGEWSPGVAWGWLDGDRQRPVMTKAGGFGDDALLMRLGQASTTRG
ncbi:four-carbon acid sugar kinase family protein [Halomonas sp. McH1-25]|uniref:four-carbon acid sugar kinase family protein n=1 Tax=unclassified Halomonas TaxID=2609666 RepID=UPI001EF555F6|nr:MULTISPECIES: four-carbon acid sugar kinase family protein [unclassified Halomonas]MCG7600026.1 four-carbon acid sugar kinase family protein [Halomonas sp. McH1-25]MCP1344121.1 four-carbon acid sugar kinase family protein [Halomonas sp. FL8]MCP1362236.1 four-carbon acid sugar kinase family protein [Halomonas sp. BBD45]